MSAVILFLVPLFHGLVFSGLAYWFKKSQKPKAEAYSKLAAVFSGSGALANIVLCIMLLELLSGLSLVTGGTELESGLGKQMPIILATQILFVAILFPTTKSIFKQN